MITKPVKVKIANGLHARPAGELVKLLRPFDSEIYALIDDKRVNLQSIIQIMTTSIKENDVITIEVTGIDEAEVYTKVKAFFENE